MNRYKITNIHNMSIIFELSKKNVLIRPNDTTIYYGELTGNLLLFEKKGLIKIELDKYIVNQKNKPLTKIDTIVEDIPEKKIKKKR